MMRKDLLVRRTRQRLAEFLAPMLEVVDKPRKRFLPQVIRGILYLSSANGTIEEAALSP